MKASNTNLYMCISVTEFFPWVMELHAIITVHALHDGNEYILWQ